MGIFTTIALLIMWLCDNVARHFKRASMIGVTLTLANTSGVVVGQIFTAKTAPRYIPGISICLAMAALGLACVIILVLGFKVVNHRREAVIARVAEDGQPLQPTPANGDYDVFFSYSY